MSLGAFYFHRDAKEGRVSKAGQVGMLVGAVALGAAVVAEDLGRRGAERRHQAAMEARQRLELQYGEVLATHQQVQAELATERQRSSELTGALGTLRARLEEAVGRLADEMRQVQSLQGRLASMQEQMDQLQGELAMSLQQAAGGSGPAELERVLVRDAEAAAQAGRVISVHDAWDFIVIDLGWDAVKIGDTVSIFRDDQLLAKARVERVQEAVSAASLLPEWRSVEVRVDDLVRLL